MNIISRDLTVKEAQEIKSKAELAYKQFCMWVRQLEDSGYDVRVTSPVVFMEFSGEHHTPKVHAQKETTIEL